MVVIVVGQWVRSGGGPHRYCVVSQASVRDAPWRLPGAVGPEYDPRSGCFSPEYVVCVGGRDYDADAWENGGDQEFASIACSRSRYEQDAMAGSSSRVEVGESEEEPGRAAAFCVVTQDTRDERGGLPLGEIVRTDVGGRCLDPETLVCGSFRPSAAEREPFGPDKTAAFRSAPCT